MSSSQFYSFLSDKTGQIDCHIVTAVLQCTMRPIALNGISYRRFSAPIVLKETKYTKRSVIYCWLFSLLVTLYLSYHLQILFSAFSQPAYTIGPLLASQPEKRWWPPLKCYLVFDLTPFNPTIFLKKHATSGMHQVDIKRASQDKS